MKKTVGSLEVITGSMFSGKSEELIRRIRRAKYAKQKLLVFSPKIDNRYGENGIYSHNQNNVKAYSVKDVDEMLKILYENPDVEVIGIDEIQFFDKNVVDFCKECVKLGKRVIVAGLDLDFKGDPFAPLPELMALADFVEKLSAICTICGNRAYASQRLIDGKPAFDDDPLVAVGSVEKYEARCRLHHIVKKRKSIQDAIEFIILMDNEDIDIKSIQKLKNYEFIKFDICKKVKDLRDELLKKHEENKKLAVIIKNSISTKIEGNYEIIDLLTEFVKISNINLVIVKNIESLLTTCSLLNKGSLNISKIYYTDDKIDLKRIKDNTDVNMIKI